MCNDCALKNLENGMCPIFKSDMTDKPGCPYHTTHLDYCQLCGAPIIGKAVIDVTDDEAHIICGRCTNATPCQTCSNKYCAFEQDQSCHEQPYVMVRKQQGNMIMQTQALNPKRIEATCRKGCPCFNEEGLNDGTFCMRQQEDGCRNHKMNWRE